MQYFYCGRMFGFLLSLLALAMRCKKCSRRHLLMQCNIEVCLVVAWRNLTLPINHRLPLSLLVVCTWPSSFDWQHIKIWLLRPCVLQWLNHSCGRLPGNTTTAHNIKDIVVVAPFATRHKRYDHRFLSCDQRSCIAMAASRSRPCDVMNNMLLVVVWCDLTSLIAINLRPHRFLQYNVPRPRYARCRLFCGQPRTSAL